MSIYGWVSPLLPSENPIETHEEFLFLQPMLPPKHFDNFPPDWVDDRFRCVQKKQHKLYSSITIGPTKIVVPVLRTVQYVKS